MRFYGTISLRISGLLLIVGMLVSAAGASGAGHKYRTFNQYDLSQKKAKAGKAVGSIVAFRFHNTTGETVNDLHIRFNSAVLTVNDAGGFPAVDIFRRGKEAVLSGMSVAPGDSVTIQATYAKKAPGTKVNYWWWSRDGEMIGGRNGELFSVDDLRILEQPNAGNVLSHLYKRVIRRPAGVVVGIPTDTPGVGWIRYMSGQRKFFPHTGDPRCLDHIANPSGRLRDLDGQLRNPHVKKHNNHLLGELHALKLAVIANDSGVTGPLDTLATLFGDLIYQDSVNSGDPFNGLTIRQIVRLADSAMTYCHHFDGGFYGTLDAGISRINAAFDGPYTALSYRPLIVDGARELSDVYFLKPNPAIPPAMRPLGGREFAGEVPDVYSLGQNYPNPFNPSTTIEFSLATPSVVTLTVYNLLGSEVATLIRGEVMEEGDQSVDFEALDLSSGVYLYSISALAMDGTPSSFTAVRKMVLLK